MADDVTITTLPAQSALVVSSRASRRTIGERMGEAFGRLRDHVQSSGTQVTGPPFSIYPETPGEDFAFQVGLPVAPGTAAGEGVDVQELPGGEAAVLTYAGPYEGLAEQWQRLMSWIQAGGRAPSAPPREIYLDEPDQAAPEDLLTQLVVPLARAMPPA